MLGHGVVEEGAVGHCKDRLEVELGEGILGNMTVTRHTFFGGHQWHTSYLEIEACRSLKLSKKPRIR